MDKLDADVERSLNKSIDSENEIDTLQRERLKIIIPSIIIDIYTGLENLLGISLSGHSDTLKEASNLIEELYGREEGEKKQHYRNALAKFNTQ